MLGEWCYTDTRIYVLLSNKYEGKVEGLCGNFNGKSSDDFGAESNTIAASMIDQASVWKVNPTCAEDDDEPWYTETCEVCLSESPISLASRDVPEWIYGFLFPFPSIPMQSLPFPVPKYLFSFPFLSDPDI